MDSDDDSLPLITRVAAAGEGAQGAAPKPQHKAESASDDDDDLPAWAKDYKSPYKGGYRAPLPQDSDDDILDLTKPSQPETGPAPAGHGGAGAGPSAARHAPASATANGSAKPTTHQSSQQDSKPPDSASKRAGPSKARPAAGRGKATPSKASAPSLLAPAAAVPGAPSQADGNDMEVDVVATQDVAMTATQDPLPGDVVLKAAVPASQRGRSSQPALPPGAPIPIVMPERVPRNKVLVELSAAGTHEEVLDLTGDAGAVGRVVVEGRAGQEELSLDLKGVVFHAVVLPLQGTAMVLNLQPAEARVEAVMTDFIRLQDRGAGGWDLDDDVGGGGLAALLGDDSDDDHYTVAGGGDDGDDKAKKKTSKSASKGKGAGSKSTGKGKKAGGGKGGKGGSGLGTKGGGVKKKAAAKGAGKGTGGKGSKTGAKK